MKNKNNQKPKYVYDENGCIPGGKGGKIRPQQPGTPGHNPNGRPKGCLNRDTIVKKFLSVEMEWKNPITNQNERLTVQEMMVLKQIKKAIEDSDTQSYKILNDDAFGKLKEIVEQVKPKETMTSFAFGDGIPLSITVTNPERFYTDEEIIQKYNDRKNE